MADIYGNKIGKMAVIDAAEAEITCGELDGYVLGANITYNVPIQPVATFGSDVLMVKGQPSGTFSFTTMAGSSKPKNGDECKEKSMLVSFARKRCATGIPALDNAKQNYGVTLYGYQWASFSIQGRAQDAFFTENVGGTFHYLGA